MNSAPLAPNSSCATSQGSRSSGAHTRDGAATDASAVADVVADNASRPGSFASRRAAKYSGFSALQRACVRLRRSRWHASAEQTRCRSPWRALGKYHRQHIRHGRFRFTTPSLPPPPSRVASDTQLVNRAPGKTGTLLASRARPIPARPEAADADHLLVYALDSEIKDVPEGGRLLLWSRREPERQWGADFVGMIKKAELRPDGTLVVAHTSPGCSTGGIGATVDELVRPASGGRALALAKRAHRCISGVPMVFDLSAREPIAPPPLGSRAGRAVRSEA